MICPQCEGSKVTQVIDSRETRDYVWRNRVCRRCGYRFSTKEFFFREGKSDNPITLSLKTFQNSWEAVWLEVRGERPILTPVICVRMNERMVEFSNGMVQATEQFGKTWRIWNRRPANKIRMQTMWLND